MRSIPIFLSRHGFTIWVVGGGPAGLTSAIELAEFAQRMSVDCSIRLFEADRFGGDPACDVVSAARAQSWLHTDGQLYSTSQPHVCLALQKATRRLRSIAPDAFSFPPAFALERLPLQETSLRDSFRALGVPHQRVCPAVFCRWFPMLRLGDANIFRVTDAVIDLRLLSQALVARARRLGVSLTRARVLALRRDGQRIAALDLEHGHVVPVAPDDVVVLACSSRIRGLLGQIEVALPGLKIVCSHLLACDAFRLPALLSFAHGGPNCVPHDAFGKGIVNVFGNAGRFELAPEMDRVPLDIQRQAVDDIRREVERCFGLVIPENALAWPARKVEIIHGQGTHSQAHHCTSALENLYVVLPGKISQSAACARDLARLVLRERVAGPLARAIWEGTTDNAPPEPAVGHRARRVSLAAAAAIAAVIGLALAGWAALIA